MIPPSVEGVDWGIERAMIAMSPFLLNALGTGTDMQVLGRLERRGVPLFVARARAEELVRSDEHREIRSAIFKALLSQPSITFDVPIATASELFALLR